MNECKDNEQMAFDILCENKRRRLCSSDTQESVQNRPWESRNIYQDLQIARSEIMSLKETILSISNLKREAEILFEREKVHFEHYRNKSEQTINHLNAKLKNVVFVKSNFKNEKHGLEKNVESTSEQHSCKITDLQKENTYLKNELAKVSLEYSKFQEEESASKAYIDFQFKELTKTLMAKKKYIEELGNNLRNKQIEISELEDYKFKMNDVNQKIKILEDKLGPLEENAQTVKEQIEKLERFDYMEIQLHSLKEEVDCYENNAQQIEWLENKVATLECQLINHKSIEEETINLRSNLSFSQNSLKNWVDICKDVCGNITESQCYPNYLHYYVNSLKNNNMIITNEKRELQNRISILELKRNQVEGVLIKAKNQIITGINNDKKNKSMIKRLRKHLYIITWERNDLREIVNSFNKEGCNKDTLEQFEKAVNSYKSRLTEIEADLLSYTPITKV